MCSNEVSEYTRGLKNVTSILWILWINKGINPASTSIATVLLGQKETNEQQIAAPMTATYTVEPVWSTDILKKTLNFVIFFSIYKGDIDLTKVAEGSFATIYRMSLRDKSEVLTG